MTCWRRLAARNEAGGWGELHLVLRKKLWAAKQLDRSWAVIGSAHVRAAGRGPQAVPAPSAAHGRAACAASLADGQGLALAVSLTG
ncbi:hypothetical protein ACIBSR_16455 [Streptomyces sp. NPDC049936]|uniref:hypothetical protein n=1 Tax=Streptomyces sp. NPDC049936 TaxID=3365599 RepID=UPI00378E28CF